MARKQLDYKDLGALLKECCTRSKNCRGILEEGIPRSDLHFRKTKLPTLPGRTTRKSACAGTKDLSQDLCRVRADERTARQRAIF
jgi:hypothetical protein